MPDLSTILLFLVAAMALLLIPGPVVLYTVTRSISQGQQAGLVSVLAAGLGDLCHVLAATFGLSALLLSSALAFSVVKYAGAAYLFYLGIRTLMARSTSHEPEVVAPQPLKRIFSQGVLVSILNPKTTLFFVAFLPQFVHFGDRAATYQILFLGLLFVFLGMGMNSIYAMVAGKVGAGLRSHRTFFRSQRYFAGSVYILLGAATVLTGSEQRQ